jgi:hypothetical protein
VFWFGDFIQKDYWNFCLIPKLLYWPCTVQIHTESSFEWENTVGAEHKLLCMWDGAAWSRLNWLRIGRQVADSCECGNELSASIKCDEFVG